jgi:hypothetical protein
MVTWVLRRFDSLLDYLVGWFFWQADGFKLYSTAVVIRDYWHHQQIVHLEINTQI